MCFRVFTLPDLPRQGRKRVRVSLSLEILSKSFVLGALSVLIPLIPRRLNSLQEPLEDSRMEGGKLSSPGALVAVSPRNP